jgi:Tfp pilus assembly protein PilF
VRKLGLWLSSAEQPQIEVFRIMRQRHPVLGMGPLHFGWLLALAVLGISGIVRRGGFWKRWGFWTGLLAVCWITSMVTFAVGRFRLPAWGLLAIPAGGGVHELIEAARSGALRRLATGLAIVAVTLVATFLMPRTDQDRAAAYFHQSLAKRHLLQEEPRKALDEVEAGIRIHPSSGRLYKVKGFALESLGRFQQALRAYEQAMEVLGRHPEILHRLGALHGQLGDPQRALALLREAQRLRPRDPLLLIDLGVALSETGRIEEAKGAWRRAQEIAPENPHVRRLLEPLRRRDDANR